MGIFTRRRSHLAEAMADDEVSRRSGLTPEAAAEAEQNDDPGKLRRRIAEAYGLTLEAAAEFVALVDEAHAAYWLGDQAAYEAASAAAADFAYDPKNWSR